MRFNTLLIIATAAFVAATPVPTLETIAAGPSDNIARTEALEDRAGGFDRFAPLGAMLEEIATCLMKKGKKCFTD